MRVEKNYEVYIFRKLNSTVGRERVIVFPLIFFLILLLQGRKEYYSRGVTI
jgi:hypothetical protein